MKQNNKQNNKQILLIFLVFSVIISLSHILIKDIFHSVSSEEVLLKNAKNLSLKKEEQLKIFLKNSKTILSATRDSKIFNNFLSSNNNKYEKSELEDLFLTLMSSDNNLMQFRYIDENGQEIIKVERKSRSDKVQILPESLLQNKSNKYYFNESKYTSKNEVWFSRLELNMENGEIELPFKPTIRAVLPTYVNDKFKGIIIINYFMDNLIEELAQEPMFKITLADDLGFIIRSHDKSKNWGFYKEYKYNIGSEYKEEYKNILANDLYTSQNILAKRLKLDLFDDIYIIFEVNEKALEEQKTSQIIQEIYLTLILLVFSLILSFIIIKIFGRLFLSLNEQKNILDRLDIASNIGNIAIWEFHSKDKEVIWSKNIYSILESPEKLSYDEFLNLIPLKERELIDTEFMNSIKEKRDYSISHKIVLKNNKIKVLEEKGKHFYDNFGAHIKSVGYCSDITEKHQADKLKDEIIKQNKKFQKLFNKFDENVIASTTNLNGIITYSTEAFCKISGYSKKELIGSPQNIVRHPDTCPDTFKELWDTIQNGKTWQGELKNKNKNGSYYWVNAIISPEYDEDNFIIGYSAIRQDITAQKEIEELNKNIKSSIEVASFIQESILPTNNFINSCFSDKFIIWEPKDIVGGDIYFLEKLRNEEECLLMVIDCTGHGVPGAFVSMLIKAIEKQITQELINNPNQEINPGKILQSFNRELKDILNQKERNLASNVGFDGGIIYYDKKEQILRYAGAANSLIYYDKEEIKTIKGDRHSIGYKNSDVNYEFVNHEIKVEKGMKFYLFSDGYIDQIGGEKNQSFSKGRTIDIINKNKDKPMEEQKEVLLKELKSYQGEMERIDDITFLAVEI